MCRIVLAMTAVLVVSPARATDDLVLLCRAGHEQTRNNIARLKCRVIVETSPQELTNPYNGRVMKQGATKLEFVWVQSGDLIHATYNLGPKTSVEVVWDGNVFRSLKRDKVTESKMKLDGVIDSAQGLAAIESPWRVGLFGWPGRMPLKFEAPWLDRVDEQIVGGVKYFVARANNGPGQPRTETWLAPGKNFLVTKNVIYPDPKDAGLFTTREVVSFAEPSPGIQFPTRIVTKRVHQGKEATQGTATIDQIEINGPVAPAEFVLTFPPNTTVVDKPNGVSQVVGEDGRTTGEPQPIAPPRDLNASKELPTALRAGWATRLGWWWVPIGIGVAVGVGLSIRAIRSRRGSATV